MMAAFAENTRKYFGNNNRVKELQAHTAKVHSVAWNSDGRKLASGSYDRTVNVFSLDRDRMVIIKECKSISERKINNTFISFIKAAFHPNKGSTLQSKTSIFYII